MRYDLNRLGPDNFESLIQSLIKGIYPSAIICGAGRDGQREFFVTDGKFEVKKGQKAEGFIIGQAKYKSDKKTGDVVWVKSQLKKELDGFRRKKVNDSNKIPDTYLFFTNVVLTPVEESGGRDQVEKLAENYKDIIPDIQIFAADDICALLENNRDVARAYTSFILPGDVLANLQEYLNSLGNRKFEALIEYARQMFREDSAVRLEQAGAIADKSIDIRNVYTDLEVVSGNDKSGEKRIAKHIIRMGDVCNRREEQTQEDLSRAREIMDVPISNIDSKRGNIVLLGNAGQGKSTVCQYICQVYRAYILHRFKPSETGIENYLNSVEEKNLPVLECERFPIMIYLNRYAKWISEQGEDGNYSVLGYLTHIIRNKTGENLSISDFRSLLSGYSWVFFFDGLDEVPSSSNRSEVLRQISLFLDKDLKECACDCLIVSTSRPQGYDDAFSKEKFEHYELKAMSKTLCKEYVNLLLAHLEDNEDLRDHYRSILWDSLDDPTVSKLMTTPLYTAIIVLLVKEGGTPPKKRYKLFQEYSRMVIKREQQKQLLPQVNGDYEWVGELHARLGFHLQLESESSKNVAAEMLSRKCMDIIGEYIEKEGENRERVNFIYRAMVKRLPFLSEVDGDKVMFPLRSIQEFFAAEWIIDFSNEDTRVAILERISVSSYWQNVYLFVTGNYATGNKNSGMRDRLISVCDANNGYTDGSYIDTDAQKVAHQGSWLALNVLLDDSFTHRRDCHKYFELSSKLISQFPMSWIIVERFLKLPDRYGEDLLKTVISIIQNDANNKVAFIILWGLANKGNQEASVFLDSIIGDYIIDDVSQVEWILKLGYKGVSEKTLRILYLWINRDFFIYFCQVASSKESEKDYWDFLYYYCNQSQQKEEISISIRQACYRILCNRYIYSMRYNNGDLRFIFGKYVCYMGLNGLLDSNLFDKRSDINKHGEILHYHSIYLDRRDYPLAPLVSLFDKRDIKELVRLIEFIQNPTTQSLHTLLNACKELTEQEMQAFFRIPEWRNNRILETTASFINYKGSLEDITIDVDEIFYDCLEKEKEIKRLLIENDYGVLIEKGYWSNCSWTFNSNTVNRINIPDILEAANKQLNNTSLISFIALIVQHVENPAIKALDWGRRNFSAFFYNKGNTISLFNREAIIYMLENTYEEQLKERAIHFPNKYNSEKWGSMGSELSKQIEKLVFLAERYEWIGECYSLIPYLLSSDCDIKIHDKYIPRDIEKTYKNVKATGNQAALLGVLICLLSSDRFVDYCELIQDDLGILLTLEDDILMKCVSEFCTDGKMLIWNMLEKMDSHKQEIRERCALAILNDLELKPVDQAVLLKLSDEGHSWR